MTRDFTFLFRGNFLLIPVTACSLVAFSCNIINPAEPVPAYVHIDSISLTTDEPTQGTSSSKIVDAWVSVDGTTMGIFELPSTFPVLTAGTHILTIRPGILINGIAATRTAYPFYHSYDTTVNFESGKTIVAVPAVTYTSSTRFVQKEDFDQPGGVITFMKSPGSDTSFVIDTLSADSFEGNSGAVYLDGSHDFFIASSIDSFYLSLGSYSFVELNYRGGNEFTVGLITYTISGSYNTDIVAFKSTDTWKKEYVNLTPFITSITAFAYKIYIKAAKSATLTNSSIYFDNIKVVN